MFTPAVLRLEPDAVRRLNLRTEPVTATTVLHATPGRGPGVPYGALLYKADGSTYVYLQTAENTFVSTIVTVDHIADQLVALGVGPPIGALARRKPGEPELALVQDLLALPRLGYAGKEPRWMAAFGLGR